MRAYLCSIGEKTTEIAAEQLERCGFEVVLSSEKESWVEKYVRFLKDAGSRDEHCIRVDADVIVNENMANLDMGFCSEFLMCQWHVYDLYRNFPHGGQPVFYNKKVFPILLSKLSQIDPNRPESWAWRLPEVNKSTHTFTQVAGMHGFFQDEETIARAEQNKIARGQIDRFDFELVRKLMQIK